jgi:hypothetical protein
MSRHTVLAMAVLLAGFGSPAAAMSPGNSVSAPRDAGLTRSPGEIGSPVAARAMGQSGLTSERSARWGVQLAGSFSKEQALAMFARIKATYSNIVGDNAPALVVAPLGNRGPGTLYRVRLPVPSRVAGIELCGRIHSAGGSCVVLPTGF